MNNAQRWEGRNREAKSQCQSRQSGQDELANAEFLASPVFLVSDFWSYAFGQAPDHMQMIRQKTTASIVNGRFA
jgi:hypothetical protein